MKNKFLRLIAATMSLCLCMVITPITVLAATDTSAFQTVAYSDVSALAVGQKVLITGTPNYSAATNDSSSNFFGVDTAEGTWYIAIGKTSVAAFEAALPAQSMTFYGVYAGTLDANNMPILDIQSGAVSVSGSLQESSEVFEAGQQKVDEEAKAAEEAAAAAAEAEAASKAQQQAKAQTSQDTTKSTMVYIASSGKGKKYHSKASCSNMKGTIKLTLSEAQSRGYTACKKCY